MLQLPAHVEHCFLLLNLFDKVGKMGVCWGRVPVACLAYECAISGKVQSYFWLETLALTEVHQRHPLQVNDIDRAPEYAQGK